MAHVKEDLNFLKIGQRSQGKNKTGRVVRP